MAIQHATPIFECVKLKILICLVITLWSARLFSQSAFLSNKPQNTKKKTQFHQAIGQVGDAIFTVSFSDYRLENGFVLDRYDDQMRFINGREIKMPGKQWILKVFYSDSAICWISVVRLRHKMATIYWNSLDFGLKGIVKSKECASIDLGDVDEDNFVVNYSPNRKLWSLVAIYGSARGVKSWMILSDMSGTILENHIQSLPDKFKLFELNWTSLVLGNGGEVVGLYEQKRNGFLKSPFPDRKFNTNHYWLRFFKDTLSNGAVEADGNVLDAAIFSHPQTGKILIAGYFNTSRSDGIEGYFMQSFLNAEVLDKKQFEFTAMQLKQMAGLASIRRQNNPQNYFFRNAVPLTNGGVLFIAEQFYESRQMETQYVNGLPQPASRILYHYGDIALQYCRQDGIIDSLVMLRKTQIGGINSAQFFGFGMYVCSNSVNIMYNDDEGNIKRVAHIKIDNTFKMESEWLFNNETSSVAILPYEGRQTEYGMITIPILKDKQWFWLQVLSND